MVDTKRFPNQTEHDMLEVEGARQPDAPARRGFGAGALSIKSDDTHNPYMRIPEADRKRAAGQRTDLRKLSSWIKMMRALEEAKKSQGDED
jgi:hypothetical protein